MRCWPIGAEGPRLGFMAPIMVGREISIAFESGCGLGAEKTSTEAPATPSELFDDAPFV